MKTSDLLVTFASWEDRFRIGFERNLEKIGLRKVLVFYFGSYASRTQANRDEVEKTCKAECIEYIPVELNIDKPADNWRKVLGSIERVIAECREILIDISTMPREIIWYVLWQVEQNSTSARYVYHSADGYGSEWLSRDPRPPRLIYKLSGIAENPSAKTALLVTVGFDPSRAERLISLYEPAKLMLGIQHPSPFPQNEKAVKTYNEIIDKYKKEYDCERFELDAFAEDRGMSAIQDVLDQLGSSYNIIMSSLGPKPTAITLYKLQRKRPEIGLVYAPSNQFNEKYSSGIGRCFEGTL